MAESMPFSEPSTGVEQLEEQIRQLRALDYRFGGGSCVNAVFTLLQGLDNAPVHAGITNERADTAVADLYSLAGWTCFDVGLTNRALVQFAQALVLAGRARNNCLVASILYRLGRVRLHNGNPAGAIEFFQAGQRAATDGDCRLETSILSMNLAWAHAAMGSENDARAMAERAMAQFADSGDAEAPDWARFFTRNDMLAMVGAVHTELAHRVDPRYARVAIAALTKATANYGDDMARSRVFSLIMLAMNHLLDGEVNQGVEVGLRALADAEHVSSVRIRDRLQPLKRVAQLHDTHSGARDLVSRIAAVTS